MLVKMGVVWLDLRKSKGAICGVSTIDVVCSGWWCSLMHLGHHASSWWGPFHVATKIIQFLAWVQDIKRQVPSVLRDVKMRLVSLRNFLGRLEIKIRKIWDLKVPIKEWKRLRVGRERILRREKPNSLVMNREFSGEQNRRR